MRWQASAAPPRLSGRPILPQACLAPQFMGAAARSDAGILLVGCCDAAYRLQHLAVEQAEAVIGRIPPQRLRKRLQGTGELAGAVESLGPRREEAAAALRLGETEPGSPRLLQS